MLVANSLKSEGIRDEVIAKKLGITKRTVKRLINLCDDEIEKDLKFMALSKKFIDEYFKEKDYTKDIA